MSALLQRLAFVTGVVPAKPVADVERSALLVSEAVMGISAVVVVAFWYAHLAVSFVWWLASGAKAPWTRYLECLVEWQTFAVMKAFGRPYPRPLVDAPLAEEWPRVRGWHLLSEPDTEVGTFESDAATAAGRDHRAQVGGVQLSLIGLVGLFCVIAGAAVGNGVLVVVGLAVAGVAFGVAAASRLLHW